MNDLIDRVAALTPDKIIQLKQRLAGKQSPSSAEIVRQAEGNTHPLSYAQERLWFLDQFQPGSIVYNIPTAIQLNAPVNVRAMEQTLQEIIRRHEVLRTSFSTEAGRPVQIIHSRISFKLPVEDLRRLSQTEREAEARRLADEEARRPFDLTVAPLLRAKLLQLGEVNYVLLLTMHHIVSDGWSMGIFFHEFGALYEAYCAGRPSPLPELELQYADYAVWQRQWLAGAILEQQLNYWKEQLRALPGVLELPADRVRPPVQSFRGGWESSVLSAEVSQRLREFSQQEGVTLFMTLLSAWQILLMRYSGQEDVVVGTPIAGRNQEKTEKLIGFFINTLVLRSRLDRRWSFREVVRHVREVCLEAYAHQDLPFEKLVEELQPERNLSHNPLFQMTFTVQNVPTVEGKVSTQIPSADSPSVPAPTTQTAKFDLSLTITDMDQGLLVDIEYATDLFEAPTIRRLGHHFQTLLHGIVTDPDRPVYQLPLLTDAERHQILSEWNNTTKAIEPCCVHELFEQQVERTPRQIAVISEQEQISYEELNRRANQLAWYLRELGVGAEVKVGLQVERGIEAVIGILAILKAGGVYMPLNPQYPAERLRYMIADADSKIVLNGEQVANELRAYSKENLNTRVLPENLAYVIYTSGSTGKPKGVAMPHGSLVNLIVWQLGSSGMSESKRISQFASLSFDVSLQEIFTALCSGASLVVLPEQIRADLGELLRYVDKAEVDTLFVPPAVFQQRELTGNSVPIPGSLRRIIPAGEQLRLSNPLIDLLTTLKGCTLYNQYGPSESHIMTEFELSGPRETWPTLPPIGKPIDNVRTYILDQDHELVPVGVRGELYIGGVALARGYLNNPHMTAEKFVPDRFSTEPGGRLYRTGDMVRYLADGDIDFLGRVDHQVKVRGFRIELGEIETVLRGHPGVSEAVVTVREETPGDKRLIAYILSPPATTVSVTELRDYVQQHLPQHMVPSAFVMLEEWPLTTSGKVNRAALPDPGLTRPELAQQYEPPRNAIEETVAGIWAEVLRLERVGVNDNFFELGGHSLLATQVVSRIRDVFQLELPLRRMFETPTVAGLSEMIAQSGGAKVVQSLPKFDDFDEAKARDLLERLSSLSDEEVTAVLQSVLDEEPSPPAPATDDRPLPENVDQMSEEEVDFWLSKMLSEAEAGK